MQVILWLPEVQWLLVSRISGEEIYLPIMALRTKINLNFIHVYVHGYTNFQKLQESEV
jgi:hypothetical protein